MEQIEANNRLTAFLIITTLVIAIFIGIYTAQSIARPIFRLNDAALKLSKGEWEQTIGTDGQVVEIKTLTQSFNQMADQLHQMLNSLNCEILERKQAEALLQEREILLRTLIETIPDLIWLKDKEGVYLSCNPKFERFLGTHESNIVGKTDYDFIDKELADFFQEKDRIAMSAGKSVVNEEEIIYADDGHREMLETIKTPMYDSESRLIGVLGISRDITERKKVEQALRREKEFTETAIQALRDTFFLFDPSSGKALRWNQSFKDISGFTDEEIARMPAPNTYYGPEDLKKANVFTEHVIKTGTGSIELDLICKNGRKVSTEYNVSVINDELENPKYIIAIGRDITDRKKMELQLQQNQKIEAIGILAGGIAHDFNNILSIITGNVSTVLSLYNQDEELFDILSEIQDGAKQAQNLTQQLLTFAKGGAPIKKVANINHLIKASAQFVNRGSQSKCKFDLSIDLWPAEVDAGQLNQVINNLVINANQAMPQGGVITIKTENIAIDDENKLSLKEGSYIKITIEDQGAGILKKQLQNIFDPFFTTKQNGSGLGLATTYSIIKRHGGHITVYSEIDRGTAFYIYLPASSRGKEKIEEKKNHLHQGHGKVLIMDDQEPILKMLGRMLNRMGYEAVFATDGIQAIELFHEAYHSQNKFDLVILDLTVPGGVGGAKTIPKLLKIDSTIKAVVSSGYSNDPIMSNYKEYGFCAVVPKPYTKNQLAKLLNTIFGDG